MRRKHKKEPTVHSNMQNLYVINLNQNMKIVKV